MAFKNLRRTLSEACLPALFPAVFSGLMLMCAQAAAQQTHLLWPDGAPGSE